MARSESVSELNSKTDVEEQKLLSVEAFEREHGALVGAMRNAVRKELEDARANGIPSGNLQRSFNLGDVAPDVHLIFRDSLDCVGQCGDCLVCVASRRKGLRVSCGIDRFPFHVITSLLAVGGAIVASAAFANARRGR